MNRPGERLRALAARLFDPSTMEQLIDPVIADLQCEHAEAVREGRLWRARWVRVASVMALCKVAAFASVAADKRGARAIVVALSAAMLVTILGIGAALAGTPATIHTRGNMGWLIFYLVPQALAISLPVCLALGVFVWIRGAGADHSRRTVLSLMRLALVLAVANVGWITPAANTAYRNVVAGQAALRGANELTFIELGQRMHDAGSEIVLDGPLPMAFSMNARLALAIAPVLLSVLALAGAAARRRSSAVVVFTTLIAFVGCYVLFPDAEIVTLTRWLPAAAIAWIPDGLVMLATVCVATNQRSSGPSGIGVVGTFRRSLGGGWSGPPDTQA